MNAREVLVQVAADAMCDMRGSECEQCMHDATKALDALLSVRLPVPCTTCSGTGNQLETFALSGRRGRDFDIVPCPSCSGSGTTGSELAIVAALVEMGVLEQVGWYDEPYKSFVDVATWPHETHAAILDAKAWRPTYRVALVDTEGTKP